MLRRLFVLATAAVLGGALAGAGPATAAPAGSGAAGAAPSGDVGPAGGISVLDYDAWCFGYNGTFKSGSVVRAADWTGDGVADECFGIAPNRTVWHAWPGSGGWREMPNGGRADNVAGVLWLAGRRTVRVYVASPSSYYCSSLTTSWQRWQVC